MQLSHVIGSALLFICATACVTAAVFLRGGGRLTVPVALVAALLFAGTGLRVWTTVRAVPGGFTYNETGWSIEEDRGAVAETCLPARALQRSADWPLTRVGYVTWISVDSQGSVGGFPRGLPVFTSPDTTQMFVGVRPGCYAAYEDA